MPKIANNADDENTYPKDMEPTDVPATHALHILQGLVHDTNCSKDINKHLVAITSTCINCFSSDNWSVRNASLQLFGAICPRILGQKKRRAEQLGYGGYMKKIIHLR